ncbi:MAG: LLM class flavin-dependent oxidoreductase [Thermoflavifilum sp.]|nr:LLM class flavin-dependent oxidoreductase [Thermoflavifilum sp.]MCL6514273.1 LLM class flavin-dependent oxidoreductase [Alicyclobacillus sp.]
MLSLSVLDQSPIPLGKRASEALQFTVRLAQETERLGYRRFWVSEHHAAPNLAGSSPEVLISYLAAKTQRIRLGSGGVMLPHYSAYKVAENFKVLEGLAPGRIDLGIGRAPGGMPQATWALQEGKKINFDQYPQQVDDLIGYLYDDLPPGHRFAGLRATPAIDTVPELWMLGSSDESALLAADRGAAFAFAQFINGDMETGVAAMHAYRRRFQPSRLHDAPKGLVAVFVVCAPTDEEAERRAASLDLALLRLAKGRPAQGVEPVEQALAYPLDEYDRYIIRENRRRMVVGSPERVRARLTDLADAYGVDEIMAVTTTYAFEHRLESYRLLAEAFAMRPTD